jgi:hypothetical protein
MITLTREEAQQVLDALICSGPHGWSPNLVDQHNKALKTLRARLSAPEPEPMRLRRGDILRCIETNELCTVWATSTTGKTLVKWKANDFGSYTAEQIGDLFWVEPKPECVCGEPNTAGVHRQDGPCYQQPEPDAIQYDKDGNEMAHWKFRSFLPAPEPSVVEDAIVYGTGITMGGNRIDPAGIYKEPEPPCKTGSQCIGGKCPQCVVPEPVGWIYEDDEGRMMFTQMPTSGLFWEPVYREKNNKGIE